MYKDRSQTIDLHVLSKIQQGRDNIVPDALSRIEELSSQTIVSTAKLAQEQIKDQELQNLQQNASITLNLKKLRVDNTDSVIYCDISTAEIRPYVPLYLYIICIEYLEGGGVATPHHAHEKRVRFKGYT